MLGIILGPEDVNMFLRNLDLSPNYTALQPKRRTHNCHHNKTLNSLYVLSYVVREHMLKFVMRSRKILVQNCYTAALNAGRYIKMLLNATIRVSHRHHKPPGLKCWYQWQQTI